MGKKSKKKNQKRIQKKKQAKSLKRRSKQKEMRKKRPVKKSSANLGIPAEITEDMMKNLGPEGLKFFNFSAPFLEMLQSESGKDELIREGTLVAQNYFRALAEQDLEKREKLLQPLREVHYNMPWGDVDFDAFVEFLLKRHIAVMPLTHSREERSRYSKEEIQEAMEMDFEDLQEAASAAAPPILEVEDLPRFDRDTALSLLSGEEQNNLADLQKFLKGNYQNIDFIDKQNPVLLKTMDFQNRILELFRRYLLQLEFSPEEVEAHLANLHPFFEEYLRDFHQNTLFACTAEEVEEYILDYFHRKIETTRERKELLIRTFMVFFTFVEEMDFIENVGPILERIEEIKDEYAELISTP